MLSGTEKLDIDWRIDKVDTGARAIGILIQSNTRLMYSFEKGFLDFTK